jgi:hypothetical protein
MEVNKNSMENRPSLSAEEALEILSKVHPEVYRGLDHGCSKSRIFFQATGNETLDRSLQSMLVRYYAKIHLQATFPNVRFDNLSLCGLSLLLDDLKNSSRNYTVQLKIWKSHENQLPPPGSSHQKVQFYTQPQLPFPTLGEEGGSVEVLRLAILWNQDANGILYPLRLVAPREFDETTGVIEVWWSIQIPDPTSSVGVPEGEPPSRPDLDIRKRSKKKEKRG